MQRTSRIRMPFGMPVIAFTLILAACGSGAGTRTATPSSTAAVTRTATPSSTAAVTRTARVTASPSSATGTPGGPMSTPEPGVTPSPTIEPGRKIVQAPIDKLELITRESQPPQYAAHITSGLPDGCTQFHEARVTGRDGTTITIAVTNTHPSDPMIACTAIYGEHDEVVELGSAFQRGTEYTVRVNDKDLRFTAQ